ncbi:MAG: LexA family protein [Acidiferrobacterales bacterium]
MRNERIRPTERFHEFLESVIADAGNLKLADKAAGLTDGTFSRLTTQRDREVSAGTLITMARNLGKRYNVTRRSLFEMAGYFDPEGQAIVESLVPVPVLQQRIPIGDSWPVEAEHVPLVKVNAGLVAIEVRGDCMSPRIEDGDFVIIDKERSPEVGKVIVFWWQGEWTLKRLRIRNGRWWMVPDNPAYEPMDMDGKEVETLGVVIRVVKSEP